MSAPPPPALIEFHDARISEVLTAGTQVRMGFRHLAVYEEVETDLFNVTSYSAELEFHDVQSVCVQGWLDSDYVSEARLGAARILDKTVLEMLGGHALAGQRFELLFGSGGHLAIDAGKAVLTLTERLRVMEQWKGPL